MLRHLGEIVDTPMTDSRSLPHLCRELGVKETDNCHLEFPYAITNVERTCKSTHPEAKHQLTRSYRRGMFDGHAVFLGNQ